jgi:hypothetical protein
MKAQNRKRERERKKIKRILVNRANGHIEP